MQTTYNRKLISSEIEKALEKHPLYSTEEQGEKEILAKFVIPGTNLFWLVFEGEKQEDGDWQFFGQVDLGYGAELGYFSLNEILELQKTYPIVRVENLTETTFRMAV